MKNIFAIIILSLPLVFFACKKQADPLDLPSIQPNNSLDTLIGMSAMVNGKSWQTNSVIAYNVSYAYDSNKVNLLVNATSKTNDTSTTISFTLSNFTGANTYTISPAAISATYYSGTQRHYATSGQIIVTSVANYAIIGTFNFVADSITVTQGVFNVETP